LCRQELLKELSLRLCKQQATVPPFKAKAAQRKQDTGVDKQRQSPLSSWIGKQLLGQVMPKNEALE
jgi:hypothetical protein